jgi:hypothetical protein
MRNRLVDPCGESGEKVLPATQIYCSDYARTSACATNRKEAEPVYTKPSVGDALEE